MSFMTIFCRLCQKYCDEVSSMLVLNKKTLLLPKIDRKMSFHVESIEKVYENNKIKITYIMKVEEKRKTILFWKKNIHPKISNIHRHFCL